MEITLVRATIDDAKQLHAMQIESFKQLFDYYQDFDTSPANENIEKIEIRLKQDFTYFYFICIGLQKVGAIRIVDKKDLSNNKRISPIFILPDYRDRGIAQKAILLCEQIHGKTGWELDTIMQEEKNRYLYEKMGYRRTGTIIKINEKMSLIQYKK